MTGECVCGSVALRVLAAGSLLVGLAGCGAAPTRPEPERAAGPDHPPLPPLVRLVPEGADHVVVARPRTLWTAPAARRVIEAVAPDAMLRNFADRTGVDPRELEELVVAEYRVGLLVLARGPFSAEDVVRAAAARMGTVEVTSDRPFVRRVGFLGVHHTDLVALDPHTVVLARDLGSVMAALLARVQSGRWAERGPAVAGRFNDALLEQHGEAPAALFVPEPLDLPEGFGTSSLLAGERALAATATPAGPSDVRLVVDVRGRFPEGASHHFRRLVTSVAGTDLGAALGLAEGLRSLRIQSELDAVSLSLHIPAASLARGLRLLFVAGLRELLGEPDGGIPSP